MKSRLFTLAIFLLATSLQAASFTWSGGGSDANFSTGANWGGTAPTAGTTNDFTFAGSQNTSPIVGNSTYIASSFTFASDAASFNVTPATFSTSSYRFQVIASGPVTITQNSASDQSISATLFQSGNSNIAPITIAGSGAGSLTLGSLRFGFNATNSNVLNIQRNVDIGQITRSATGNGTLEFSVAPSARAVVTGPIAGSTTSDSTTFALQKTGLGTLVLSGINRNSGTTTVSAGTLLINSDQTTATGNVSVANGATIGGTGTIGGATTISGSLEAGDGGVGLLSFANGLTLNSGADSVFDINGLTRGTEFDAINVIGALVYSGTLTLDFGFTATVGQEFDLFNATSHSGNFSSVNFLDAGYGGTFDYDTGILTLTSVPEPATAAMCVLGGLLTISLIRRRKSLTA